MAGPAVDDEDDKPLDPAVERVRRKLVRFAAINLGILLLALMAVAAAIVYKSGREAPGGGIGSGGELARADIPLPAGARIVSQSLSGDRIAIDAELVGGSREIFLYDMAEQRLVGRFTIRQE